MATNNWGTLKIEAPDFLPTEALNRINQVADFMVSATDIGIAALEIGKAASGGSIDPISSVLAALVDEINSVLRDFNQAGIYIAGDWALTDDQLQGGYQEYERRMIIRLTDRTDPTRPDVSGNTPCLALFLYVSNDGVGGASASTEKVKQFILQLAAFFQQKPQLASVYPIPQVTEILYGTASASTFEFRNFSSSIATSSTPPDTALVKWKITPSVKNATLRPYPGPAPGGFYITLSTLPDGIEVVYDRPRSADTGGKAAGGQAVKVQPREYGSVVKVTGEPLVLFGGADMLAPLKDTYNAGVSGGALKNGATRVYGRVPGQDTLIPLEQLKQGDTYFFQRTFYIPQNALYTWLTGDFTARFKSSDMPRRGRVEVNSNGTLTIKDDGPASTIYLRIAASGENATVGQVQYQISSAAKPGPMVASDVAAISNVKSVSDVNLGQFSRPVPLVFPNVNTAGYLEALKAALTVLALSRPDLDPLDTLQTRVSTHTYERIRNNKQIWPYVALQRSGLEPFLPLANTLMAGKSGGYREAIETRHDTPEAFRTDLMGRIEQLAHDIYSRTGPLPDVEAFVVQNTERLRTVTWKEIIKDAHPNFDEILTNTESLGGLNGLRVGLFESLRVSGVSHGLARNPYCLGLSDANVEFYLRSEQGNKRVLDRAPHMQEVPVIPVDPHWAIPMTVAAADVQAFLDVCPPGLKSLYESSRQSDGSILVREEWRRVLEESVKPKGSLGSADLSPVFVLVMSALSTKKARLLYCRGLFASAFGGEILQQAAIALGVAGAAAQRPENLGDWVALRPFDIFPVGDELLATVSNWAESLQTATEDASTHLNKAIESLQARGVEIQQMIRRVDAITNSLTGYTYLLPACSVLATISNGTDGLLGDLVTASNKPSDSPLSYGGGLVLVVPVPAGGLVLDFLRGHLAVEEGNPDDGEALGLVSSSEGIGGTPEVPPESDEPDVL